MNDLVKPARRRGRLAMLLLGCSLALAACRADPGTPPLYGATMGGPFTLTSQDGRRVSDTDFAGRYRLVYFGYTYCPDVCPVDLQNIGAGLRVFEQRDSARAARVQPIFITVDPARDTPEVLSDYVANFHPRLIGLTGSEEEIARTARAYGVHYRLGEPAAGGGPDTYLVDHSRVTVLYGPDGEPISIVAADEGPGAVTEILDQWVR